MGNKTMSSRKRKTPDNDECDGNDRKKTKYPLSDDSDLSSDSSEEIDSDTLTCDPLPTKLQAIVDTFELSFETSEYSSSDLLKFSNKLKFIADSKERKIKEMQFREESMIKLRQNQFQSDPNDDPHFIIMRIYSQRPNKKTSAKVYNFAMEMVKGFRFKCFDAEFREEENVNAVKYYNKYSLDIALKTNGPHPKYKKKIHGLLNKYIPDHNVGNIVIEYAQNGYQWYQL